MKSLVAEGRIHYSGKVRHLIAEGWHGEEDLRACICSDTFILKVEMDELGVAMDGRKYTIRGWDTCGRPFHTCGKIVLTPDNQRLYFFITAHEAR